MALAYHVDYWNYLGWADTLATKENTARQYAYARMFGRNGVYTPQAVLNGRDHMNGGNLSGIRSKLAEMKDTGKGIRVPVEVVRKGDEIDISIGAGDGKANIVVVYFTRQQVVDVETGENSGKKISYFHAVRDIQTIGMWDGKPTRYVLPATVLDEEKDSGCAVLVQKMKSTEIPAPSSARRRSIRQRPREGLKPPPRRKGECRSVRRHRGLGLRVSKSPDRTGHGFSAGSRTSGRLRPRLPAERRKSRKTGPTTKNLRPAPDQTTPPTDGPARRLLRAPPGRRPGAVGRPDILR